MRIIYEGLNGLNVVVPVVDDIDVVIARSVPDGFAYHIVSVNDIPTDRYFRNAWKINNGLPEVDMTKARSIHMDKIRVERDKSLASLDLEYIKADEASNNQLKLQIAAEKKRLRDLPVTFDLSRATTPEQLKSLWPVGL